MKRRRPDLIVVLAILVGLGVVATELTQGLIRDAQGQAQNTYAASAPLER
jgi:hypothetical protein